MGWRKSCDGKNKGCRDKRRNGAPFGGLRYYVAMLVKRDHTPYMDRAVQVLAEHTGNIMLHRPLQVT